MGCNQSNTETTKKVDTVVVELTEVQLSNQILSKALIDACELRDDDDKIELMNKLLLAGADPLFYYRHNIDNLYPV